LQVIAELVDVRNNSQIWRHQYNRKVAEISDVEAEISRQIAERLQLNLTSAEQQRLVQRKKPNPQAYELPLERAYIDCDSQLQYLRVEPHFDSLRSDPRFADLLQRIDLQR
jgi:hypothetical protein